MIFRHNDIQFKTTQGANSVIRFIQRHVSLVILVSLLLYACSPITPPAAKTIQVLRLATTTSTADSGLLEAILPNFEQKFNARVDVVAVGTGQAIEIGASGDADVILVHARAREDEFVAGGHGSKRLDVMYNDFVVVGPVSDPAGVKGIELAKDAFAKIAESAAIFASRGDDSGTHTKEKSVWSSLGITPSVDSIWYLSVGQGMGETLNFANEKQAYTLSDRATWLSMREKLSDLTIIVGGEAIDENKDKSLLNPYGVIPVNPATHPGVNFELATQFAQWITSPETQAMISEYGKEKFGQSLFYPNAK